MHWQVSQRKVFFYLGCSALVLRHPGLAEERNSFQNQASPGRLRKIASSFFPSVLNARRPKNCAKHGHWQAQDAQEPYLHLELCVHTHTKENFCIFSFMRQGFDRGHNCHGFSLFPGVVATVACIQWAL